MGPNYQDFKTNSRRCEVKLFVGLNDMDIFYALAKTT